MFRFGFRPFYLAVLWVTAAALLSACGGGDGGSGGFGGGSTGSIVVQADWDDSAAAALSLPGADGLHQPVSVITVRAIVSAADIGSFTPQDFPAAAGGGTIIGIPAGVNRTLTLQGLDGINNPIFEAIVAGLTITAGATTDAGAVTLTLIGAPLIGLTVTPTSGLITTEAGGTATFTIRLNTPPTLDVTVPVSSSDTTEARVDTGGGPMASDSLVFTIVNWSIPQTVTVVGQDDAIDDGNQAITITTPVTTSGDVNYNGLNPSDVSVSNSDNDFAGITVNPTSGLVTTEAGATAIFTVVLDIPPAPATTVTIPVTSGDTTEALVQGGDSPATPVTTINLTFTDANWSTPQTVTVVGQDDIIDDGNQAITIITAAATGPGSGYDTLNAADVLATNNDDDNAGITVNPTGGLVTTEGGGTDSFTIVLDTAPTASVMFGVSSSDTTEVLVQGGSSPATPVASITMTFTTGNWNTPQTVTVVGQNDPADDGNQAVTVITAAATSGDGNYSGINPSDVAVTNNDDDNAGITVNPTGGLVTTEAGGTDTFTVVLDTQPTNPVTIGVSSSDTTEALVQGGNSPATPLASITLTFTNADWSTPQTVTVVGQDDAINDGNQAITILTAAAAGDGTYVGINAADVSATNNDNDIPGITVNPTTGLVTTEAGGTDTFTVVLNAPPTNPVTIGVSSSDTTEALVQGGDFPATPVAAIVLTFTNGDWSTPQTVTVVGQDDAIADGNQAITALTAAAAGDAAYVGINASDVSATNNDNDTAGITVNPTGGLVTTEAGGTDTFTVVLNTMPLVNVTIGVSSSDTTEAFVQGGDSPATPVAAITLTFTSADWSTPQTVTVVGQDDAIDDGNQAITILTAAAAGDAAYVGINAADVSATNNDNDVDGISVTPTSGLVTTEAGGTDTFTVVLDTQPTNPVTIGISSSDTSEALVQGGNSPATPLASITLTFTNADWSTPQTVTVVGQDDAIDDGNQAITIITAVAAGDVAYAGIINAADVSATNNDDDAAGITVNPTSGLVTTEAGGTDTFTVVLDTQPGSNVTIGVSSSNALEALVQGGNSPATPLAAITLTFTNADWSTPQTVTVVGQDDAIDDGNQAITITTAPAAGDAAYAGINAADVSATNNDDDLAGITVTPTSGLVTTELGGTDTFTVVLDTQPAIDVTIGVSSPDTTEVLVKGGNSPAIPVASITLTFTNADWSTPQTVTLVGVDDGAADGNIAVTIATALAAGDAAYVGIDPANVSVTNNDNETKAISVTPTSGLTTSEAGGTDTFNVVLTAPPTAASTVTLPVSSNDTSEVLVQGGNSPATPLTSITLTFTDADWSTPQTVTVVGQDDSIVDGDITAVMVITGDPASAGDAGYNALTAGSVADVSVTNTDDGEPPPPSVVVTPTSLTTTEGGSPATFDVNLNTAPDGNVVIDIINNDTTELTVDKTSLTFTTGNFAVAQTVTVTGIDDAVGDGNQTVTITVDVNTGSTADTTGFAVLNPPDVQVTNLDVTNPGISVIPTSGLVVSETLTTDTFSVVLNKLPTGNVVIDVVSQDSTELSVDKASLTFTTLNWFTPQVVTATGVDDAIADGNLVVTVALTVNQGSTADPAYDVLNPADVLVTVTDDDAVGVSIIPSTPLSTSEAGTATSFTLVLNTQPDNDVVIDVVSLDITEVTVSPASLTFDGVTWSTPQTVTVFGENDALVDGNQTVTVSLAMDVGNTLDGTGYLTLNPPDVTVVNSDDDVAGVTVSPISGLITSESGTAVAFNVVLNTTPDGNVVIDVVSTDASEVSVDKAQLTFTVNDWATAQTVTVTGLADFIVDGNQIVQVTVDVDVGNTTDSTGYQSLNPSDVTVENIEIDVVGATLNPATGLTTTETGGTATFSVRLNTQPVAGVVEILVISGDTNEVTVDKAALTFTDQDWATPQVVTLTGVADGLPDGNQVVTISLIIDTILTTDTSGYDTYNPPDATVTNIDNTPFVTVTPIAGLVTTEGGGTDTFTVVLNTQPTGNVLVDIAAGVPAGEVTSDKTQLTFTINDWNTPQTVTLTGVEDVMGDGDQVVNFALTINGATVDTDYLALDPPDVSVTNRDNDTLAITVNPTVGLVTTEGGGIDSFTVSLSVAPDGDVVIDVASAVPAEVDVDKSILTFTIGDWQTAQTVTVQGQNDSVADGDQAVSIALTMNGLTTDTQGYALLDPDDPLVTNLDNEDAGEGSAGTPLDVSVALPHEGTVNTGLSYYEVSGLTPGADYFVSVNSLTDDLTLTVYEDLLITVSCGPRNAFADARPESCVALTIPTDTLFIVVDGSNSVAGSTFTVDVILVPTAEGAVGTPLDITASLPGYMGGVDNTDSYYVVTGLAASQNFLVRLTSLTDNVDLFVHDSNLFNNELCLSDTSTIAEACIAQSTATGELFIWVQNRNATTAATYVVDILVPPADEGSVGSPIDLTGVLPFDGQVLTAAGSFYVISGLIPGTGFTVNLNNMSGSGGLEVYDDALFTNLVCTSNRAVNLPETCSAGVIANGSGKLYIIGTCAGACLTNGATYTIQLK